MLSYAELLPGGTYSKNEVLLSYAELSPCDVYCKNDNDEVVQLFGADFGGSRRFFATFSLSYSIEEHHGIDSMLKTFSLALQNPSLAKSRCPARKSLKQAARSSTIVSSIDVLRNQLSYLSCFCKKHTCSATDMMLMNPSHVDEILDSHHLRMSINNIKC